MIIILSGRVHGGKTTFIQKSLSRWALSGCRFNGFLSLCVRDAGGNAEYDFLGLKDGLRLPFLRRTGEPGWEQIGPHYFVRKTLAIARSVVLGASPDEVLIVDEVGPLELTQRGLWPALREVIFKPEFRTLLVVREDILEDFFRLLGGPMPLIIDVSDPNAQRLLDQSLFGLVNPA